MEGGDVRHNIERGPPKDHPSQICFNLNFNVFLAHLAKGHVRFCHHLVSVVRRKLSHLNQKLSQIQEAIAFTFVPPAIPGLGV
jgi:hypothetical protein